ncbi:MAG: type II secretion system minor pseudopilin GspK [Pseudomonadota bacterium]
MAGRASQSGVALITALLVTAIVVVIAVSMTSRQQLDIRRSANVLEGDQAYLLALGVESWALGVLAQDQRDNKSDNLSEAWATMLPPIDVEGGKVAGRIEDMQARFNLNNLVQGGRLSNPDIQRFQRLLRTLQIDPALAQAVVDWIDPDSERISLDGAEDDDYLLRNPPYRAANAPLTSVSELRLIKGFTADIVTRLAPFVTALPTRTDININTARPEVLMTLADNLSKTDAEGLVQDRGLKGYPDIQRFIDSPMVKSRNIPAAGLSVASGYFLLDANAQYGRRQTQLYSLITRTTDGKASVVLRGQGAY